MTPRSLVTGLFLASTGVPTTAMAVQSAELYRTQAYVYGRFEARVQYAAGDGVVSSFFLWKNGSAAGVPWNELDYEKVAADCHMQTNAYTGTGPTQHSQTNVIPGNICAGYHTYAFEWTPTYISWSVDGQEIRRETGAVPADFATNATVGMTFHFNIWPGNANFGGNFNPAILPVREYISWVQYSSYVNGGFQLQWREEFNSTSMPSGWDAGNRASPYGLSTHNPQNVSFVNGIAILSLTADNATGFSGTPPADTAGTGGTAATGGASATGGNKSTGGTAATGGTTNAGGMIAVGGSSTAVGSIGGAVSASGGATSMVAAGASAVAGTTGGPNPGDTVGSCSCKISESRKSSPIRGVAATIMGLGLLLARRH